MNCIDDKLKKGYVKIFRSFVDWEWFTDINVCHLFLYCILRANHSDTEWRGINIKRGSFITSRESLAISTGLSIQQVRTAIKKLKLTNELTIKTTSQYSIITIKNYDLYQENNKKTNQQITNEQPTNNQRITTDNNELIMNNNELIINREREEAKKTKFENDPFTSKNVSHFINEFKTVVKKRASISPDERLKLLNILNDLTINQNMTIEDISTTVCKNFKNIKSKYNFGINWLLRESNFYSILNGEWTMKESLENEQEEAGFYIG